jgi:hypothetical protein
LRDENGIRASKNIYFKPFKELVLPRPNLSFETEYDKSNILYITVKSDYFAKGVHLTCDGDQNFSDNFFDMPINGKKTVLSARPIVRYRCNHQFNSGQKSLE